MTHKIRDYIASRLGIRSQGEMGIELGRYVSEGISKGITDGYEGGRRMTNVGFKRLSDTAVLPTKAHATDAGFDLFADETVVIEPGRVAIIKTGIAVKLPEGYEATVRGRSGITSRTSIRVNLGTIDQSYTGEIGIITDNTSVDNWSNAARQLDNHYAEETRNQYEAGSYIIRKGDKLAQLVVSPVATFAGVEITDLDETTRGSNGFGSTGV